MTLIVNIKRIFLLLGISIGFLIPQEVQAQSANEVFDKMRNALKKEKSISIAYEQSYKWKSSNRGSKSAGKLDMQDLIKFRLYTEEQTIVSDGESVWSYTPFTKQVIINRIDKSGGTILPGDFLSDYPKDYRAKLLKEDKFEGEYLLELKPKESGSFVTAIRIWVDGEDYLIRSIEYIDINQNVTLWEITEINLNPNFDDSHFKFDSPSGVETVDLR
ncbi:MAG: outer membrane lipoprotein carrier protein LolA [Candidatus Marinimicrobia bacterium]|nr:outer membrane lipoprotein carrier protein LolA [Candidatus Neomarinimicrobiota bacterium]